jgi:hypothetical protein
MGARGIPRRDRAYHYDNGIRRNRHGHIFLNSGADYPARLIEQLLGSIPEYPGTQVSPTTEEVEQ